MAAGSASAPATAPQVGAAADAALAAARKLRDVDKRERSGKRGVGGGANLRRSRGRGR